MSGPCSNVSHGRARCNAKGETIMGRGIRSNNPIKLGDPDAVPVRQRHGAGAAQTDVYFLTVHEPYRDEADGYTVGSTVVHARSLLHAALPQPDASLIYRCVTEFPGRASGEVVPLSTVTFELAGGDLWPQVGDWAAVSDAVEQLARQGDCDSLRLPQDRVRDFMLANGPATENVVHAPDGTYRVGPQDRQGELDALAAHIATLVSEGSGWWPGAPLVMVPAEPPAMPYNPLAR